MQIQYYNTVLYSLFSFFIETKKEFLSVPVRLDSILPPDENCTITLISYKVFAIFDLGSLISNYFDTFLNCPQYARRVHHSSK